MRKSVIALITTFLVAVVAGAGVATVFELRGGDRQRDRVYATLKAILPPEATVTAVRAHGRPFLVEAQRDRVSSADATISAPGREPVQVFLRGITPSGRAFESARSAIFLPLPPVVRPLGWSDRAMVGDTQVRYTAELRGDEVAVTASDAAAPLPLSARVVVLPGQHLVNTRVTHRGLLVVLDSGR